jgi:hypothetical protein
MAIAVLTGCTAWVNQYDFSSYATDLEANVDVDDVDATTFGSGGWREYQSGLRKTEAKLTTFMDTATGGTEPVANALLASNGTILSCTQTGAQGSPAVILRGFFDHEDLLGKVGEMAKVGLTFQGAKNEGLLHGNLVAAKQTQTTSGNVTGTQMSAVGSTGKLWSALHVFSASGTTPSLTALVKSSSTLGGAYTTRITHTAATAAGSELVSLAGPITDTFYRVDWTISGTTPSFSFAVVVGIA